MPPNLLMREIPLKVIPLSDGRYALSVAIESDAASGAVYAGTAPLTTAAAAIGSQACSEVLLQSDPANTVNILVGSAGAQPIVLTPGDAIVLAVANISLVYAKSASGTPTLNWLARG